MAADRGGGRIPSPRLYAAAVLFTVWVVLNLADVWVMDYDLEDQTSLIILGFAAAFLGVEVRSAWRRNGDGS